MTGLASCPTCGRRLRATMSGASQAAEDRHALETMIASCKRNAPNRLGCAMKEGNAPYLKPTLR